MCLFICYERFVFIEIMKQNKSIYGFFDKSYFLYVSVLFLYVSFCKFD